MSLSSETKHIELKYLEYELEDFLLDKSFINWVTQRNAESEQYWQDVVLSHPEKRDAIEKAKNVLKAIHFRKISVSDQQRETILRNTLELRYSDRSKHRKSDPKTNRGLKII